MSRKMKLDFTGVESFQRASAGEHVCKIATADEKQSQSGNDMIVVAFEVIKGDDKSARVFENYPLIDTALWKLKGLLQAIGMKADGKVQLDLDRLIGKTCIVGVKHEEYDGKTRARVDYVKKLGAAAESDDEEEEELPFKEEEEEDKPAKAEKPKATEKKAPKKPEPVDDDDEDDDDDWDDEEDEKPAPKKKPESKPEKKPAKPEKAEKKPAKKAAADDDDDWDDDDWDE